MHGIHQKRSKVAEILRTQQYLPPISSTASSIAIRRPTAAESRTAEGGEEGHCKLRGIGSLKRNDAAGTQKRRSSATRPRPVTARSLFRRQDHLSLQRSICHATHGDTITKYTTFSDDLDTNDHPNEAHTTIPVPEVVTSGYIAQMRALGGIHLGHRYECRRSRCTGTRSRPSFGAEYPIVFTHGDVTARNIIVRNGRIVALLDWEFAGWYLEYWDYVFTLRGMDNIDWVTLGRYLPSLFAQRYDLEYILVKFILSLS
ncbi:kinase-like domain-containing protein [Diplogelasinospora grovesii]|uniref:Kinase-like domain-containing protein n=1 Tax=Diplogelasinospora grovesii TaxID=303347 RepID=A0AAN6N665_9PEZI|nr:kinase-like domain-containing protein [Diplogelasinospora grovesii]